MGSREDKEEGEKETEGKSREEKKRERRQEEDVEEELSLKMAALHHFGRCPPVNYAEGESSEVTEIFAHLHRVEHNAATAGGAARQHGEPENPPDRSPVAAEAPKKYPVGRRTPPMSMHSFHSFLSSTSTITCGKRTGKIRNSRAGLRGVAGGRRDGVSTYSQPLLGVADGEVRVVISVADLGRAAPQLRRAAVFAVVVLHRAVVHHG